MKTSSCLKFRNKLVILRAFLEHETLPELSAQDCLRFMADPVVFFIRAGDTKANAIWREIERQHNV